jgi:hypothetical protein
MKPRALDYAIVWAVLAAITAIALSNIDWWHYRRLADHGVRGEAIVIGMFPEIHRTLRYEYHVAGRSFRGQTQPNTPNPPLEQLAIGQPVVVFYDPEKPEDSVRGDPKPILQNETISVLLGATIIPIFLIAILMWKTSRKNAIQAQAA